MKKKKRRILLLGLLLSLAIFIVGCGENQSANETKTTNDVQSQEEDYGELKSFETKTLTGETFTEKDFAKKDVTAINCWSVSCGPCVEEMPELAKFSEKLPENIRLITLCLDSEEEIPEAKSILKEAGFTGTTILMGNGDMEKLNSHILYTPTTIFVDGEGNIIGNAVIGGQENLADTMTAAINSALKAIGKDEITVK